MKRRQFLQHSSLAAAGTLLIPQFLQALQAPGQVGGAGKVLVVIQLSGGNDGLNTVIPFKNDIYYRLRPTIGIAAGRVLPLEDDAGLHPALPFFRESYHAGELTVLNQVGYPNPDRSHFRSMDIWHTASASNAYLDSGWLGRYLDAACAGCSQPTQVLEVDDMLSLALKGEKHKGIAVRDPRQLAATTRSDMFRSFYDQHHFGHHALADYLYRTLGDTMQSAETILQASRKGQQQPSYPDSALGKGLKTIGGLIGSSINTRVYYISHGSFDTHFNQAMQQQRLLAELNDAVAAFVRDLKQQNRFRDVLILTFSEFGRRVAQNASGGTDHGTANSMLLLGGNLRKAGLWNPLPTLQDLPGGDIPFTVDFRSVYSTILQSWLDTNPSAILDGSYQHLGFV
jgi:uncharacterized protein (DUF1501 family)